MGDWATPLIRCRRVDAEQVEDGGHHVDDVGVLRPYLTLCLDVGGPVHDERIARSPTVGLSLPAPQRCVPGKRPAPGVVIEVLGAAQLVDHLEAVLDGLGAVVEELRLVGGARHTPFCARTVVRDNHDQGVVELLDGTQELDEAADVVVGVAQEAREDLHLPGVEPALIRRQCAPVGHVGIMARELAVRRHDPEFLLACEGAFPVGVPAVVELSGVLVGPFLGDVMGGMGGPRAEVEVEGLVGVDLLGVGDELHRLVRQVRGEVVPLLGCRRWFDLVVVVDQVGVPLAGVAAEEAVEALEAATERPAVVGPGGRLLTGRNQVPFADHVGVVPLGEQDL